MVMSAGDITASSSAGINGDGGAAFRVRSNIAANLLLIGSADNAAMHALAWAIADGILKEITTHGQVASLATPGVIT